MRIAFYAPLKPPDHPTPSGDRQIARLLLKALAYAGHDAVVVSRFRTFDAHGDDARQRRIRAVGHRLAKRLARRLEGTDPQLWLTYHVHHKAPDLLGPIVSTALRIPYVIAEASIAPRQRDGRWAVGYADALTSICTADAIVSLNPVDVSEVSRARGCDVTADLLSPFIDVREFVGQRVQNPSPNEQPKLVSVAMMRDGAKMASYRVLAAAMSCLAGLPWRLHVIGDGPRRDDVEALFMPIRDRVVFLGELDRAAIVRELLAGDVFVWPAIDEAFGLAFIEAQACGVPVIGADTPGVRSVVAANATGLLPTVGDVRAFAEATRCLITDTALRSRMAGEAWTYARQRHDLASGAARLDAILRRVMDQPANVNAP